MEETSEFFWLEVPYSKLARSIDIQKSYSMKLVHNLHSIPTMKRTWNMRMTCHELPYFSSSLSCMRIPKYAPIIFKSRTRMLPCSSIHDIISLQWWAVAGLTFLSKEVTLPLVICWTTGIAHCIGCHMTVNEFKVKIDRQVLSPSLCTLKVSYKLQCSHNILDPMLGQLSKWNLIFIIYCAWFYGFKVWFLN
jgi:hypothetical protein